MARFALDRDIKFFEGISRELVDAVVENTAVIFKMIIESTKTNIYGESLNKTYYPGIEVACMIERGDTTVTYDGFGSDQGQTTQFRFNRFSLEDKGVYPEIGDIIYHNDGYFEIDNIQEDQLIGGRANAEFSIICSTFMTRKSTLQIEERNI